MPHLAIPPSPCSMSSPCLTEMTSRKEMLPFSSLSDGCEGKEEEGAGKEGATRKEMLPFSSLSDGCRACRAAP